MNGREVLLERWEPVYAHRPEAALRLVRADRTVGTIFKNWQGWISAFWREHPEWAETKIHADKESALNHLRARAGGAA